MAGQRDRRPARPVRGSIMAQFDEHTLTAAVIARIAGSDTIGESMVGKDPVEGFTWEIKKK